MTGPLPPPQFSRGQSAYGTPARRRASVGPRAGSTGLKASSGGPKASSGGPKANSGGQQRASELLVRLQQQEKRKKSSARADANTIRKAFAGIGQQPGERIAGFLSLDRKARKAYVALPEKERQRVDRLLEAVKSPPGDQAKLAHEAIEKLLANKIFQPPKGKRSGKEAQSPGNPVLAELDARLGKPLTSELAAQGLDVGDVTQQIVTALAFPGWVFQGKGTATCVPASLETILAKTAPAEYARVAGGLLWDGQVTLRGGQTLELSTAELGINDGGRGSVHQLLQGSMLRLGQRLGDAGEEEDPFGGGRYARPAVFGAGTYLPGDPRPPADGQGPGDAAGPPPAGLTGKQASLLYEQVVGDPVVPFKVDGANRKAAWSMVKAAVAELGSASVGVATVDARGMTVFHEITITRIGDSKVEIADSGLGDTQMVPIKQLKADLQSIIVPTSFIRNQSVQADKHGESSRPWFGKMVGSLQAGDDGLPPEGARQAAPAFSRKLWKP